MAYPDKMKEQMKELTDRLEQGVKNVFTSGHYEQYLHTMSQFHQYSSRNSMLIWLQRPDATRVAGFNTWKNTFGRSVNKGEKGIRIFAPSPYKRRVEETHDQQGTPLRDENGNPTARVREITVPAFKPVPVFDVSQTSGRELPSLASQLTASVDNYDLFFESLKKVCPYPIGFEEMSGSKKGYYHLKEQRIAIKQGMAEAQNVKTAIHEITHARLHSDTDMINRDRQAEELEAESTAFVVCNHYGIDTSDYSFGYVARWSGSQDLAKLQASLNTIQKAASELINDIDGQMQELVQQRATELKLSDRADNQSDFGHFGNPEFYKRFYAGSGGQDKEAADYQRSTGWSKIWASDSQGENGDTWIVYRSIDDLPKHLQNYATEQEQSFHNDQLTLSQDNSTPKAPSQIDAPFVPVIAVLHTVDNPEQVGLLKYQVEESGQVYSIDGDEDCYFPVNTIDLDTGEKTVVGFDHLRECTFEANAYRNCLFENDAANIGIKNLHYPEHPGKWEIVDKIILSDDTYFAVAQQGDLIPDRQYMIVDQSGEIFIDQAFKGMEQWGHRDLVDSVSSTLAEQEAIRINSSQSVTVTIESAFIGKQNQRAAAGRSTKPSIGDKLEKAKQSLTDKMAVNKPTQHAVCAGMER